MSDSYQQDQSGWEWVDQEEERWHADNISELSAGVTQQELVACQPIIDNMLAQFDQIFMSEGE